MPGEPRTGREMTPDELVAKAETFEVIDGAITIPAMWPRLILERERAAAPASSAGLDGLRTHPHDGYAYDGCTCVCCLNVRALSAPSGAAHRPNDMGNPVDAAWEALVTALHLDDSDYDTNIDQHRPLIEAAIRAALATSTEEPRA